MRHRFSAAILLALLVFAPFSGQAWGAGLSLYEID
jgi:hypothetical protein